MFPNLLPETFLYVKTLLIKGLGDPDPMIRSIVGNDITTIVSRGGFESWPELLPTLISLLDSEDYNIVEVGDETLRVVGLYVQTECH